jgi:tetratricopeptide (TPR) repeat protein
MLRWILIIFFLFLLTACDTSTEAERPTTSLLKKTVVDQQQGAAENPAAPAFEPLTTFTLLKDTTEVHSFETTAEALSVWRRGLKDRPTLLLLSNNPHMRSVPEELQQKAAILVHNANLKNLRMATNDRSPSPLLLPGMALDIAMRSGWFREVAWALPLRDAAQDLSLEKFKSQLSSSGIANEPEIESLTLNERILSGTLRNTPIRAAALPIIKGLDGPVIVHIDLSYFQPIYKNEISTPLLDIIYQTLVTLQKMHLDTLAVTFSYGHLDSQIALDVRFLGDIISYLIENPQRLEEDIPLNWQRQRDALYLANFFKKEEIKKLHEAQEQDDPNKAWVKFSLYRSAAEHKEGTKALDYLAEAVTIDPMFALEYPELSNMAYDKQRPDEALRMLQLAADAFHEDPFIKLQIAQLANELGDKDTALEMLNKVRNLTWSDIYYPNMKQYIADLTAFVRDGKTSTNAQPLNEKQVAEEEFELVIPDADPSRQRVMHSN